MASLPGPAVPLQGRDSALVERVIATSELAFAPGALQPKHKLLMAMALDALGNHERGVQSLANRAREAGATEEEILETLRVAFYIGGMQALSTGVAALASSKI